MSRYSIRHKTGFRYTSAVVASYNEVRMLPIRDDSQVIFSARLEINPRPLSHEYTDHFGNRVVVFELFENHDELEIISSATVELRDPKHQPSSLTWDELPQVVEADLMLTDFLEFTKKTTITADLEKAVAKIAASCERPAEAAVEVCQFIHSSMTYQFGVTSVHSGASEAWNQKIGVCQDYAHIAIGALRSIGIPARYVSGYLHPQKEPKPGQTVVGESHAWIEWYAGNWEANDPTNNIQLPTRHITVARGRDYDDVPPLRGVFAGGCESELFVQVEITLDA